MPLHLPEASAKARMRGYDHGAAKLLETKPRGRGRSPHPLPQPLPLPELFPSSFASSDTADGTSSSTAAATAPVPAIAKSSAKPSTSPSSSSSKKFSKSTPILTLSMHDHTSIAGSPPLPQSLLLSPVLPHGSSSSSFSPIAPSHRSLPMSPVTPLKASFPLTSVPTKSASASSLLLREEKSPSSSSSASTTFPSVIMPVYATPMMSPSASSASTSAAVILPDVHQSLSSSSSQSLRSSPTRGHRPLQRQPDQQHKRAQSEEPPNQRRGLTHADLDIVTRVTQSVRRGRKKRHHNKFPIVWPKPVAKTEDVAEVLTFEPLRDRLKEMIDSERDARRLLSKAQQQQGNGNNLSSPRPNDRYAANATSVKKPGGGRSPTAAASSSSPSNGGSHPQASILPPLNNRSPSPHPSGLSVVTEQSRGTPSPLPSTTHASTVSGHGSSGPAGSPDPNEMYWGSPKRRLLQRKHQRNASHAVGGSGSTTTIPGSGSTTLGTINDTSSNGSTTTRQSSQSHGGGAHGHGGHVRRHSSASNGSSNGNNGTTATTNGVNHHGSNTSINMDAIVAQLQEDARLAASVATPAAILAAAVAGRVSPSPVLATNGRVSPSPIIHHLAATSAGGTSSGHIGAIRPSVSFDLSSNHGDGTDRHHRPGHQRGTSGSRTPVANEDTVSVSSNKDGKDGNGVTTTDTTSSSSDKDSLGVPSGDGDNNTDSARDGVPPIPLLRMSSSQQQLERANSLGFALPPLHVSIVPMSRPTSILASTSSTAASTPSGSNTNSYSNGINMLLPSPSHANSLNTGALTTRRLHARKVSMSPRTGTTLSVMDKTIPIARADGPPLPGPVPVHRPPKVMNAATHARTDAAHAAAWAAHAAREHKAAIRARAANTSNALLLAAARARLGAFGNGEPMNDDEAESELVHLWHRICQQVTTEKDELKDPILDALLSPGSQSIPEEQLSPLPLLTPHTATSAVPNTKNGEQYYNGHDDTSDASNDQ